MKKKKILAGILAALIVVGAGTGIGMGVKASSQSSVLVFPANELNYGGYWGSDTQMDGIISSDASQEVYVTDTQTVSQVMVKEGAQVKKGDVLLSYDMAQTNLSLEKEKLSRDQIDLKIQVAEQNLKKLKNTTPVAEGDGGGGDMDFPDMDIDDNDDPGDGGNPEEDSGEPTPTPTPTPSPSPSQDPVKKCQVQFISNGHGRMPDKVSLEKGESLQDYLENLSKEKKQAYLPTETGYVFEGWYADQICRVEYSLSEPVTGDIQLFAKWKAAADYKEVAALSELKGDSLAYNQNQDDSETADRTKLGSLDVPYRYLCTDQALVTADFMNTMIAKAREAWEADSQAHYYFLLEIHQGDSLAGELRKCWMQDAVDLVKKDKSFPQDWQGILDAETGTIEVSRQEGETSASSASMQTGRTLVSLASLQVERTAASSATLPTGEISASLASLRGGETSAELLSLAQSSGGISQDTGNASSSLGLLTGDLSYTKEELEGAIREQEASLRDLKLDRKESDLKISQAEKALGEGVVRAKMNGVVKKVSDPQSPPTDGSAFLVVNSSEGLFVRGGVSELLLDQLHEGDSITVMSWQSGTICQAVIQEISPYPDESGMFSTNGNATVYPFTAYISEGGDGFSNQEWVQITLSGSTDTGSQIDDGSATDTSLYLWKAFIREEDGEKYVYLRGEDGRLKKQVITVGRLSNEGYEILSGVTSEDWLAFPYGKQVKAGAKTKEGTVSDLYNY